MKTGLTNEKVSFPFQKLKVLRNFKAVNDSLILRIAAPEPAYAPPTSTSSLYSFQQQSPVAKWLNTWTSNQKVIGSSAIESTWIFFFSVTCVIDWKKTYFSIKDFCPKLDSVCSVSWMDFEVQFVQVQRLLANRKGYDRASGWGTPITLNTLFFGFVTWNS